MINLTKWDDSNFARLCREILKGLGMSQAKDFPSESVEKAFRITLVRESTDGLFRTDEGWLCVFVRPSNPLDVNHLQPLKQAALAADISYALVVVFGTITTEARTYLREVLAKQNIDLILLAGSLAETLAIDYGQSKQLRTLQSPTGFSFARLRRYAQSQVEAAPWHEHFQTTSIQPMRLLPLNPEDVALAEADLFRALKGGSFLLLGEPGAGKTTSLLSLASDTAKMGGLTPVYLPLGRYQGNFWNILCEALCPGSAPISKATAQSLITSGALVILLDGLNEVQNSELHARLVEELNRLTAPDESTLYSRWIASGRVHDYQHSHNHLVHLESHRWEIQPLTADLIFRFLASALGEAKGLELYHNLGDSVRDICSNPLLLNMVLTIYREKGRAPTGRGALYRQFIELLLKWGGNRGLATAENEALSKLLPQKLTEKYYKTIALESLTSLAAAMSSTMIKWTDANKQFGVVFAHINKPNQAAALLLEDLTRRGILRRDVFNRVSFIHHTFQEYFQARHLIGQSLDDLIIDDEVPSARREAMIFLSGLLSNPISLIKRVLNIDPILTSEMIVDSSRPMPINITRKLAKELWHGTINNGELIGERRRWAIEFKRVAQRLGKTVEALAEQVDSGANQMQRVEHLMQFYAELGDVTAQRRLLSEAMTGEDIPEELLFQAAIVAASTGDHSQVIDLYTEYLEKNPNSNSAFHNRANAYKAIGKKDEALADYQRAVEIQATASNRTSLARLLVELDQRDEAHEELLLALDVMPSHAPAHALLADLLEPEDPETALIHREQAVAYAPHDDDLRRYYHQLAASQEKLGHLVGAIRSIRQMIVLDPTSTNVTEWKKRIAHLRQLLDAEARTRSARERLQEHGELPLPTLAVEWLRAAGLDVKSATATGLLAEGGRGLPERLPVVLMTEPMITGASLRAALDSVPSQAYDSKQVVFVTASESLSLEARHQLAALQDEYSIALTTALEVRDALLQSDRECRLLLDRTLMRAGQSSNPFDYKGIVRENTEFFGRIAEIEELTAFIRQGQQVGLFGIHKIGKSSLLEQLRRRLHISNPEITVVEIELDASLKDVGDLYRQLIKKLNYEEVSQAQMPSANNFRQVIVDFHQRRLRERPNHKVLIIIDEYAYLIPDRRGRGGLRGFIEALGLLKTLHQEGWLQVLPCGRTAAINRQASWGDDENPFIDMFHSRFLGPLPREENDALMTTLGMRAKLSFTPEGLAAVYDETGGHPAFSRALGSRILLEGQGEVTETRVQHAVDSFLTAHDQRAILLAIYEDRLDEDEQTLARLLAMEGPQPYKELFPKYADMGRRRQFRDVIANMVDTTVLIRQPDGSIAHRYGLLRRVIQQEVRTLGLE